MLAPYSGWLRWLRPYHTLVQTDIDAHYYNRRPVAGVHQINRLTKQVRLRLRDVTCPVLAFSGEGDQTVDIDSGEELVSQLGSEKKLYKRYGPDVPHILTREGNPERDEMFALASQFLLDLAKP